MSTGLVAKLHPDRFTEMSGRMPAIVGYILDERFTDPAIAEMVVTSNGFVLARTEGDVSTNERRRLRRPVGPVAYDCDALTRAASCV